MKTDAKSCETSQVKVHRCRFAKWVPSGIAALSFNSTSTRLAVVRESGDIEIWNVEAGWFCERAIPGPGKRVVSEVLWQIEGNQERLFSAGLNGLLIEWDLLTLLPKHSTDSCGGGPIHSACLKATSSSYKKKETEEDYWAQNASVAVGCHDGSIRLFDTSDENGFVYVRALHRHSAPALCVDWKNDMLVSSGADGTIRIWDTRTGALTSRITVESYQDEPTLVWQVKIIDDKTIVSGDSLGHVQFWDAEMGTLLQNFVPHQADVLALTVAPGGTIFASGVDPLLTKFSRVNAGKWVVSALHRSHSHDVNAIAVTQTDIISKNTSTPGKKVVVVTGGKDSQLCAFLASETRKPVTQKLLPFLHRSPVSVAAGQEEGAPRRFLLRNGRMLQLYQVGSAETPDDASMLPSGATVPSSPYHHLVDIKTDSSDQGGLNLCASDLSQDCQWAACSDTIRMSLFHFRPSKTDPLKLRTRRTPCCLPAAYTLCFTKDSKRLIAGCLDSSIMVYDLQKHEVAANFDEFQRQRDDYDDEEDDMEDDIANQDGILHILCVSNDNKRLAACDHLNRINVFNLETLKLECTLPRPKNSPTAMSFHPDNNILVVTCASNDFFLYDVQERKFDDWSRINGASIPKTLRSEKDRIFGITFDKNFPSRMLLMSCSFICKVDLSQPIEKEDSERPKKMQRTAKNHTTQDDTNANFRMIREFKPLLGGDFISSDELLLVEIPWIKVLEALPPTFERRKYGT